MRISIEGIRGSGKSSILKLLQLLHYKTHVAKRGLENKWTELYVKNQAQYALGYNLHSLLEQTNVEYHRKEIHLYENSPYTLQNIWSKIMVRNGHLSDLELQLQEDIVDTWGWIPECIIFLDCPAEVCLERVKKSKNHASVIDMKELQELSHEYDWAMDYSNCDIPVYRVNANDNLINVFHHVIQILHQIRKHSLWFKNQNKLGNYRNFPTTTGNMVDIMPVVEAIHNSNSDNELAEKEEIPNLQVNPRTAFGQLLAKQNYIDELLE